MSEFDINNPFMGNGNGQDGPPQAPKVKIDPKDLTNLVCEKCDHNLFQQLFAVKRVSPIVSGAPKTTYIPIQVLSCANCGAVPEDFQEFIK